MSLSACHFVLSPTSFGALRSRPKVAKVPFPKKKEEVQGDLMLQKLGQHTYLKSDWKINGSYNTSLSPCRRPAGYFPPGLRPACLLGGPSLCRDRRWRRTGLSNSDQLHFQSGASQRDPAIDPLPVSAPWRLFPGLSKSLHFRLYHNHSFLRPQFSSNSLSSSHTRTFCSFIRYSKMQLGMVNMQNRTVTSTNSTFLPFPKSTVEKFSANNRCSVPT